MNEKSEASSEASLYFRAWTETALGGLVGDLRMMAFVKAIR